ncbi:BglG family transcription antiterminator LicT [Numidum massiliense]|uniref:BglG family transcription antiterminator LicT n=1 Tax=Numidum massiliense TaxID=1522315 RepID=UPI0006D5B469|nr:PRD domain-containing protein [Numidum massiliense]
MKIKKVFNNNVALTQNEQGQEMVVMGRGLTFQKRAGEVIDPAKIEKTFIFHQPGVSDKLADLLQEIPEQYLALSDRIISYAKSQLETPLDDYLYVALTDHLSFAINRHEQGVLIRNVLLWEIRKYYKKEFQIALTALNLIEEETGVSLPEDEAGFIAMHLVNGQNCGEGIDYMVQVTKIVDSILSIVKYHYHMELNEGSVSYERFLTHLRFFALRYVRKEVKLCGQLDNFLYEQVRNKYEKAFQASERIALFLERTYDWVISADEKIYLTLHIHRVTSRQEVKEATDE